MTTPATQPPTTMPQMAASFPAMYEEHLVGPLFAPWAARLLDAIDLRRGSSLLDVACGTGIVARIALDRTQGALRAVGVDRNPAMLDIARRIAPATVWREGDATALPIAEEPYDLVCCHQGLQFIPDRNAAVREMRRALAPRGGVVAIGVWRSLAENGLFHELDRIAERFVGPIADARHSLVDERALAGFLEDAGFRDVAVERVSLDVRFEEPAALVRLNAMAVVGMSGPGKTMSDGERAETVARIVDASGPAIARYSVGNGVAFPTSANIATARA